MKRTSAALVLALAAALPQQSWKTIEPGLELVFPRDHGAHSAHQTEWWYVTGQLEDELGARYGFQFTVFRRGLDASTPQDTDSPLRARQVYAGHLALTEVAAGRTRFAERLRRASPLARAQEGELDLVLEDWTFTRAADDRLTISARDPAQGFGLALELRPEKPLVLHGERGYSAKGSEPGNASAYVSWTRLATDGKLELDGAEHRVRGSAWFDHEFGTSALGAGIAGWDWFGLQLDDGRELMLFVLRDASGHPQAASAATLVERDGTTRSLGREQFTLASSASWSSPKSGATYPARWTITLPSAGLHLEIVPLVADCELASHASTAVTYWEGPVTVSGTVTGRGYAELTGYAGTMAGRF